MADTQTEMLDICLLSLTFLLGAVQIFPFVLFNLTTRFLGFFYFGEEVMVTQSSLVHKQLI